MWEEKKKQLGNRIRKLTGRSEIVEDLLQEIFVKFYPKAERLERGYAGRYLMRSATNIAIDYLRRQRQTCEFSEWWAERRTPYHVYEEAEREQFYVSEVVPALESLSHEEQEAIGLYMTDRKRAPVARDLGIPVETLYSRQMKAIKKLRRKLGVRRDRCWCPRLKGTHSHSAMPANLLEPI